jgi:hypothetical protein
MAIRADDPATERLLSNVLDREQPTQSGNRASCRVATQAGAMRGER